MKGNFDMNAIGCKGGRRDFLKKCGSLAAIGVSGAVAADEFVAEENQGDTPRQVLAD